MELSHLFIIITKTNKEDFLGNYLRLKLAPTKIIKYFIFQKRLQNHVTVHFGKGAFRWAVKLSAFNAGFM